MAVAVRKYGKIRCAGHQGEPNGTTEFWHEMNKVCSINIYQVGSHVMSSGRKLFFTIYRWYVVDDIA